MEFASTTEVRLPDHKPPAWANSVMKWACMTPGIQKMVGRGVALLTFTGRRTGHEYTVPVSFQRDGDVVTIVTKRQRKWWHNFEEPTRVGLRIAGTDYAGNASIWAHEEAALDFMMDYLDERPLDAKAYGLGKDELTRDKVARIIPQIVVIAVRLDLGAPT